MKQIRDLVGRELKWTQPHAMKREFELRDGEEVVATLRFRSLFGSLATAETADGSWTFKRVGFWRTRVTVRPAVGDVDIATFRPSAWRGGGTLELAGGERLRASTNTWGSKYEFKTASGEPIVQFHRIRGPFHLSSKMLIERGSAARTDLSWLAALGWYLAVKVQDDAAAGAAAGAVAAAAG